jgi:hypothetical protein
MIKEQGFGQGVNLAQRGLSELRNIGQEVQNTGNEIEEELNQRSFDALSSDAIEQSEKFAADELNKPEDSMSQTAFTGLLDIHRDSSLKSARNGEVRNKLKKQYDMLNKAYTGKIAQKKENYNKKVENEKNTKYINNNAKLMGLSFSQGDIEGAETLREESFLKIDKMNISQLEKDSYKQQYNSVFKNTKISAGLDSYYDEIENNINNPNKDEIVVDENIIKETSKLFSDAIEDPSKYKQFWKNNGFDVNEDGFLKDPTTDEIYSSEEIENLKKTNETKKTSVLNKFLVKNEEKIQEKDLLLKVFQETQFDGKKVNELQLQNFENQYKDVMSDQDINTFQDIKNNKQTLSIESFSERNKVIKEMEKTDLFGAMRLKAISDKRQMKIMEDPAQFIKNSNEVKIQDIDFQKNDITMIQSELSKREEFFKEKEKSFGFKISRLTKNENKNLISVIENGSIEEQQNITLNIIPNLTKKEQDNIAEQSFQDSGVDNKYLKITSIFDNYGSKSQESKEQSVAVIRKVDFGRNIREENKDNKDIKENLAQMNSDLINDFSKFYRGEGASLRMNNDFDNAMNYAMYMKADKGELSEEISEDELKAAFEATSGKTANIGQTNTITPNFSVSEEDMDYRIRSLNINNVNTINTLPTDVTPEGLTEKVLNEGWTLEAMQVYGVEDNVYRVRVASGSYLQSSDGGTYKLALTDVNNDGVVYEKEEEDLFKESFSVAKAIKDNFIERVLPASYVDFISGAIEDPSKTMEDLKNDFKALETDAKDFKADIQYYREPIARKIRSYDYSSFGKTMDGASSDFWDVDIKFGENIGKAINLFNQSTIKFEEKVGKTTEKLMNVRENMLEKTNSSIKKGVEVVDTVLRKEQEIKDTVIKTVNDGLSTSRTYLYNNINEDVKILLSSLKEGIKIGNNKSSDKIKNQYLKQIKEKVINEKVKYSKSDSSVFDYNNHVLGTLNFTLNPDNLKNTEDTELAIKILESYLIKGDK